MFIKYIIKKDTQAVVVKFDLRNNSVILGGYVKFIELINTLLQNQYFGKFIKEDNNHSQRNKVRFIGIMKGMSDFIEIMDKIKQDFDCEKVKRVERLI